MDDAGVDIQVLSLTTPGTNILDPGDAVRVARDVNDLISAAVAAHPTRFEGFATVPTPNADAAVEELDRAVESRLMFSTDYSFLHFGNGEARAFLEQAPLDDDAKALIAHGNWDALCTLRRV